MEERGGENSITFGVNQNKNWARDLRVLGKGSLEDLFDVYKGFSSSNKFAAKRKPIKLTSPHGHGKEGNKINGQSIS